MIPDEIAHVPGIQRVDENLCAIYFLVKDGRVIYVGQTGSLNERLKQHRRGDSGHGVGPKDFDEAYWIPCRDTDLDKVEAYFVETLKPLLNKKAVDPRKNFEGCLTEAELAKVRRRFHPKHFTRNFI